MTLDEALADIERRFTVHPDCGDHSIAPTGESYIEFTQGGLKAEGDRSRCLAQSEQDAVDLWHEEMVRFVSGKVGTLYWRFRPEIDFYDYRPLDDGAFSVTGPARMWQVYSRFLLSDKPVIRHAKLKENGLHG